VEFCFRGSKMKAQIMKYKVNRSMKRLLLIGNGSPSSVFAIQLDKTFKTEDAQQIIEQIEKRRF